MKKNIQAFITRQEMESDTYEIFHYMDPKKREVPLHHHDFYEIYLFLGGQVDYRIESKVYHLRPTNILLFPPNVFHQPLVASNRPYERIVLWLNPKFLKSIADDSLLNCFQKNNILNTLDRFDDIRDMLNVIANENNSNDEYKQKYVNSVLVTILCELNRLSKNNQQDILIDHNNATIDRIINYIDNNYTYGIKLDDVAKNVYLNKYYLSHLFTSEVGTSVCQYIQNKKLVLSKELLEAGYSPKDAAQKAGFGDYTSFYRSFKDEYGISPKELINKT